MNNQQLTDLAFDVLDGKVSIDDLPADQVDAVIMRTYEFAVEAIDSNPNCSEGLFQLVEALQPAYDDILGEGSEKFAESINEAETRGSFFWAPEEFAIH
jgi:hypothetical protein